MDEQELRQPVTCRVFRDNLFLFQSDEMAAGDRSALQEHLNRCDGCARRLALEDRLLASVKNALPREKAPAGLETRIRRALAEEPGGGEVVPLRPAWWKDPMVAAMAAVLLLAALLAPVLLNRDTVAEPAVFSGTIVDYQCDREGLSIERQRECLARSHTNALKLEDGSYVHFNLHQAAYRQLITEPDMRGRRFTVRGNFHPEIRTLEVVDMEELPGRL